MDWRKEYIMITRMPSAQDWEWCAHNLGKHKNMSILFMEIRKKRFSILIYNKISFFAVQR